MVFWDWMHCLCASGGVAQHGCNEILRLLQESGVSLLDIDHFHRGTVWSVHDRRLPADFFQRSFSREEFGHLKCFASETILASKVLHVFMSENGGSRRWPQLHRIVEIMDVVIGIFQKGDAAYRQAGLLRAYMQELHVLYLEVWGADMIRPKNHYLYHICDCMERHKMCTSTFSNERRNKILNAAYRRVRRKDNSLYCTSIWVKALIRRYKQGGFCPARPLGKARECRLFDNLLSWQHQSPSLSQLCLRASFDGGSLMAGQFLKHSASGVIIQAKFFVVASWSVPSPRSSAFVFGHEYALEADRPNLLQPTGTPQGDGRPFFFELEAARVSLLPVFTAPDGLKIAGACV
jgi:hypothetical protein